MTRTIHVFDRTVHEAHDWINELTGRLGWSSERDALRLLRTVMCKIRDHLPVNEMAQFAAQLPLILRGMYYEGWQPKKTPVHERDATDFIKDVETEVGGALLARGEQAVGDQVGAVRLDAADLVLDDAVIADIEATHKSHPMPY